jgi:hypothetical protein
MSTPTTDFQVQGDTSGVPAVYNTGTLNGSPFIFVLKPSVYKMHKIRFVYTVMGAASPHSIQLLALNATANTTNVGSFSAGQTWGSLSAATTATNTTPTMNFGNISAYDTISGEITVYSRDVTTGLLATNSVSDNIAIDIITSLATRIFGNVRFSMPVGTNLTELRYTFAAPASGTGYYTITGYPQ